MARMCFGAHILRQQEAGITDYTSHAQQDYQQDLTCMFAYAQSKGYFRKGTAARHLIPRLANITPRSRHDKIALVDEFVQHYESVQCDLLFIKDIITVNPQVDLDVVTTIRDCLSALHLSLAKGVKWRTIMPYTPLPKACLPMLRDFIANPKHFRFFGDLTHTVVDLETWLNPPPPCIEFLARLKVSVMDTSQQENEKTTGNPPPSPPPQDDAGTEPLAKLIEQGMEQVGLVTERVSLVTEKVDLLANKVGLLEEQLQQAEIARTRITQNISVLEVTSAEQKAENTLKEERWVAAASQIRKEHCEHIARQNSEIERIKIGVDGERTRCVNVMANTSQMLAEANERINILASLPSSLPTSQPWNSPVDLDQSSDMMDIDQKTISSSNGFSAPNLIDPGNSNPLASYLAQDTTAHQHVNPYGPFKEACRDFKLGTCRRGKKCRLPHRPCRHWLIGNCKYREKCNRSHDPFFLGQPDAQTQSSQHSDVDLMSLDDYPHQDPYPMTGQGPFGSIQPSTLSEHAPPLVPSGPNVRFAPSTMNSGKKVAPVPHFLDPNSHKGGPHFSQLSVPSGFSRGPYQSVQLKKQACQDHLHGKCNEGRNCKYAHKPCPFFVRGSCRFTDETCNNSHDPLYFTQANSSNTSQGLPPQYTNQPVSHMNLEEQLQGIIQAASKTKNPRAVPTSSKICRWQSSPFGCTNARCKYEHNPPKLTLEQG